MSQDNIDEKKVVKQDRVIILSYSILNGEGRLIEARPPDNPVQLLVGHGQILKALETKILGETEGFKGDFTFTPAEAHGAYKKELVVEMKKNQFPEEMEIKKGMKFESRGPNGEVVALHVLEITGDKVLVDGNHPLAGEELRFDVNILEVRDAAKEEIARGKVMTDMEPKNKTLH
jgi:FKBP-type peptidyl-prolyl cis-trans isomerase SlyD